MREQTQPREREAFADRDVRERLRCRIESENELALRVEPVGAVRAERVIGDGGQFGVGLRRRVRAEGKRAGATIDVDAHARRRVRPHVERAHQRAIRVDDRIDARAVVQKRDVIAVVARGDRYRRAAPPNECGDRRVQRGGRHAHHRRAAFNAARRLQYSVPRRLPAHITNALSSLSL